LVTRGQRRGRSCPHPRSTVGLKFTEQKGVFNHETFYIADFYLPKPYKLWIEIDGAYHDTPKQKKYDKIKDFYLTYTLKFRVLRLTNEKAESITIDELKKLLSSYIRKKSPT